MRVRAVACNGKGYDNNVVRHARTRIRVRRCCQPHKDEGEGEGGQWCARTKVTTTTTMLLCKGDNIVVVVVTLSHLHCRVVGHARTRGQWCWWGSDNRE